MQSLVAAWYWLALSTWFGAVLMSAIAPPVILRVIQRADPTLLRVLSVNLDRQHSTLLASEIVGELLAVLFRVQVACAAVLLPALIAQWFLVDRTGDGTVWLTVHAFSRAAKWYARAGGPATRGLQQAYARRCGTVLRRLAASPKS